MICPVREEPARKEEAMTATTTSPQESQVPEAPEVIRITLVGDLPEPVRADIIARRQAGETLAELKTRFAHVDPAIIREVLPPANKREAKQREAKTEVVKGVAAARARPSPNPSPRAARVCPCCQGIAGSSRRRSSSAQRR